jgi:hypothetical protein
MQSSKHDAILAILAYSLVSNGMIISNKLILSSFNFPMNLLLLAIQVRSWQSLANFIPEYNSRCCIAAAAVARTGAIQTAFLRRITCMYVIYYHLRSFKQY